MNPSLLVENRNLRAAVNRLQKESQSLREQCQESCHENTVEEMRKKYGVPRWLLSKTSHEVLARKDFAGVEAYMADRARLFNTKLKLL